MKKRKFTELSRVICSFSGCKKHLKLRIVEQKPTATTCYNHHKIYESRRGHTIDTQPRRKRVAAGLPVKNY